MIIVLALVFTLVLAGVGFALVRAYALGRPMGFGGGPAGEPGRGAFRTAAGRPASTLFGGRRWAVFGCYSALAVVILSLVVVDGMLLFLISVARS